MMHEDNVHEKTGPTYDQIRANLLINYQNRTWEIIKHIFTIETATLTAWYFLNKSKDYHFSLVAIGMSILILCFLYMILDRYSKLMGAASQSLNHGKNIYLRASVNGMSAARLSKSMLKIIITFNALAFLYSAAKAADCILIINYTNGNSI